MRRDEPTRLQIHERGCRGLRRALHTLSGHHVWLAEWDLRESDFMVRRIEARLAAIQERIRVLDGRIRVLNGLSEAGR